MRWSTCCAALLAAVTAGCASVSDTATSAAVKELAPTGKLRVGVVAAPATSAFFVVKEANGAPRGVTADLGRALAARLGVPIEFTIAPNSGEVTKALGAGALDVSFMPVDDARRKVVDFGTAYFVIENTYLVRPGSDIKTIADVDRAGTRVIGIANTATIRNTGQILKNTTIAPATSVADAMELLRTGKADALALTRDSLPPLAAQLPGSRILDGSYHRTDIAIAVPKNRPQAQAYVTAFMEEAKASGLVRRAFDAVGLKDAAVAPAATRR